MEAELRKNLDLIKKETIYELTRNMKDIVTAKKNCLKIMEIAGSPIKHFPHWHPLLKLPTNEMKNKIPFIFNKNKTRKFYFSNGILVLFESSENQKQAKIFFENEKSVKVHEPQFNLYKENISRPLIIESKKTRLGVDGTILSFDAIILITQHILKYMKEKKDKKTWTEMKPALLGKPMCVTSSAFVTAKTMANSKKIYNALIESGYNTEKERIKEDLVTIGKTNINQVGTTLITEAIKSIMTDKAETRYEFDFKCRGQDCHAFLEVNDKNETEIFVKVIVGSMELVAEGEYFTDTRMSKISRVFGTSSIAKRFL